MSTAALHPNLPFTAAALLAPMEGVTDPLFRSMVLERNPAAFLGGATTEFVRVSNGPIAAHVLRRELVGESHGRPVGLQIMGGNLEAVAATAIQAAQAGVPFVDLNFGCPAKGALRGCAGSALLDDPRSLGALVSAVARALEGTAIPLTAKLRAGGEDDTLLEELVRAATDGGAAMIAVHCRTRQEGYRDCADWRRLERAVKATPLPICGNGGIESHADIERLLNETGCCFAMIGRAALADPWIFSGHKASTQECKTFFAEYAAGLTTKSAPRSSSRIKQLVSYWKAGPGPGGLFGGRRRDFLRLEKESAVLDAIEQLS